MARVQFRITDAHLAIMRRMHVEWQNSEDGAPCIDSKRPYGNSCALKDIAKILGVDATDKALAKLHRGTEHALQICLVLGEFKTGLFERADQYDVRSWRRVDEKPPKPMPLCLRCSECEDEPHHWMESHSKKLGPHYACKHCPATCEYGDGE